MITIIGDAISLWKPQFTVRRIPAHALIALTLLAVCPGCQWMYTDMNEPASSKKDFVWNDSKPKSSRNSFNMSGLSDESQAIEKNLGGK